MEIRLRIERAGKTIVDKTVKNIFHHEGMYQVTRAEASEHGVSPKRYVFIEAGSWDATTKTGSLLTEFEDYTVDGGGSRALGALKTSAFINAQGQAEVTVWTTETIVVTAPGTITGITYTRSATKGSIGTMYFSIELDQDVEISDVLFVEHRITVGIDSDLE